MHGRNVIRLEKLLLVLFVLYCIRAWRSARPQPGVTWSSLGLATPLLEQPIDRTFNSGRVWVALGLCYRDKADLVQAALASTLWRTLAGVNVVLQVLLRPVRS